MQQFLSRLCRFFGSCFNWKIFFFMCSFCIFLLFSLVYPGSYRIPECAESARMMLEGELEDSVVYECLDERLKRLYPRQGWFTKYGSGVEVRFSERDRRGNWLVVYTYGDRESLGITLDPEGHISSLVSP